MATVRLGPGGEIEVSQPAAAEELAAAEEGLDRVIAALVRLALSEAVEASGPPAPKASSGGVTAARPAPRAD